MNSRTKRNERLIPRIWAVISACMLIGLSSGAAFAAPLESAGSPSTAPAAPQGAKTAAIKAAIKVVVKTLRKAAAADTAAMLTKEGASSFIGRLAAKHAATIATRLEVLLKYETLVLQTIEDQVKSALVDVGVASTTATTVGFFVKKAVDAAL